MQLAKMSGKYEANVSKKVTNDSENELISDHVQERISIHTSAKRKRVAKRHSLSNMVRNLSLPIFTIILIPRSGNGNTERYIETT